MPRHYTISAFTQNTPGVLHRLTAVFTRRKVNIESLTVSETERAGVSRFTIVVVTLPEVVEQIAKQINRIIEVVDLFYAENEALVFKELALYKVRTASPADRSAVEEEAHRHQAIVIHAAPDHLVVERSGSEEEITSLYFLLERFGISEFIRSGRIAIARGTRAPGDAMHLKAS